MQIEIIMVTRNNLELTEKTIATIQKYTREDFCLIIVDNNSSHEMQKWLNNVQLQFRNIAVNFQKENIGLAKARNIGMKLLGDDCEYVLFVDNDIEIVQKEWLLHLLEGFIEDSVGAVGPCSDYVSGLQNINLNTSKKILLVPFLITFCILIRRKVVDKIGDFDSFGASWGNTDIDYSVRMRKAGYKLINMRDVFVKHKGYETKKRQDELVVLRERFIKKWGQKVLADLYNFNKWMNLPENKEKKQIEVVGVSDKKKKQIETKLGVHIFQNQIPGLDNTVKVLSEEDQKLYESKLDTNKKLALFELPAGCNLSCEYCYVKNRRIGNQNYNAKHIADWLVKIDDRAQWIVWLCSEGETAFYPGYDRIIDRLVIHDKHIVATTTNLTQNYILNLSPRTYDSLGILWSVHYEELERKGLLDSVFERAGILADRGASIAPLVITTKYNMKRAEEISSKFRKIGLKPTLRHERIFPKDKSWYHREFMELWEIQALQKMRESGNWSFINYDYEHLRFHVKGGSCSAGMNFLAVLTDWSIVSCCGCGQKLGEFPELPKEYKQGLCTGNLCPCPFPHELGMNSGILTPTMAQSYFYNNINSMLYKALDVYLLSGLRGDKK